LVGHLTFWMLKDGAKPCSKPKCVFNSMYVRVSVNDTQTQTGMGMPRAVESCPVYKPITAEAAIHLREVPESCTAKERKIDVV
jgi:hypothetical protein